MRLQGRLLVARPPRSNGESARAGRRNAPNPGPQSPKGPLIPVTAETVARSTKILTDATTDEPDYEYMTVPVGMSGGWV